MGDRRRRWRRNERGAFGEMTAGALIPVGGGWRTIPAVAAMVLAMDDIGARTGGRVDAGGDRIIDATKVEGRKQNGQQSRECEAMRERAPSPRQPASDRGQRHVAPPKAVHPAHAQSGRSKFVNNLDELFGYDRVRAACKTKPRRAPRFRRRPGIEHGFVGLRDFAATAQAGECLAGRRF